MVIKHHKQKKIKKHLDQNKVKQHQEDQKINQMIKNIQKKKKKKKNLHDSEKKVFDLLDDNSRIRSEAIYKEKQNKAKKKITRTGLKTLTLRQIL